MAHSSISDAFPTTAKAHTVNVWLVAALVVGLGSWLGVGFVLQLFL